MIRDESIRQVSILLRFTPEESVSTFMDNLPGAIDFIFVTVSVSA